MSISGGWEFLITRDSAFLYLRRIFGQSGYNMAIPDSVVWRVHWETTLYIYMHLKFQTESSSLSTISGTGPDAMR